MNSVVLRLLFWYCLALLRGSFAQSCQPVSGYAVVVVGEAGTLVASWQSATDSNVTGFRLEYSQVSSSSVLRPEEEVGLRTTSTLTGLLNFTMYRVSVRAECGDVLGPEAVGQAQTIATVPSGRASNLMYTDLFGDGLTLVNISWSPIPEDQWNGIPNGYFVYLFRHPVGDQAEEVYRVPYPATSVLVGIPHGRYGIRIVAYNNVGPSDQELDLVSEEIEFGDMIPSPDRFVDYPFFYILIPGVIFLAITMVIIIVICKKVREGRKGAISFVRDIDGASVTYAKGYGNAMQMHELSPQSPNASITIPGSMVTSPAFSVQHQQQQQQQHQQQHQHSFLANRPLPLSPHSEPTLQPAEEVFTVAGPVTHGATNRMISGHPGPLPMLEENVEQTGFVPMTRTLTEPSLGSVFSPVSSTSAPPISHQIQHAPPGQQHAGQHAAQQQQQRGRSNTLPSPYEVPDTNGNTLPHDIQSRPSQQRMNMGVAGMGDGGATVIPPPPAHSPPPFTLSAQDISQMPDNGHHRGHHHHHQQQQYPQQQHGGRQNTLPRAVPNQRSFSTSAAHARSIGPKGLSYMKSEGNIHEPTYEGDVMYIQPPMDSDPEHSIVSTSSYGQGSEGMGGRHQSSLERGRQPYNPHHQHHHHQPHQQQSRHPGMINGALATSSDQFGGNFGPMGEGLIPMGMQSYPVPHGARDRDAKRESLFSETSTELSVSSNSGDPIPQPKAAMSQRNNRKASVFSESDTSLSSKEGSPDWDYRGTKSDLGMGHRRQRSRSPPERETFSEVGSRGHVLHTKQNGFV